MKQGLFVFCLVLALSSLAFGWAGNTHSKLAEFLLYDPVIAPFISEFGIDRGAVIDWTSEPPDAWHHPGWGTVRDRGYLGVYNGMDWTSLNETTRLRYLIHIATDCGVPLGHSPANDINTDTVAEAALEAQVGTWDSWPSVAGTTYYQHSRTGYAAYFTGTYGEVMNTFYSACINNATWFKSTPKPWYLFGSHTADDNRAGGWNGTAMGQMLGRAMLADYFLAKRGTVAVAGGSYGVNPGGSVTFSSAGSNDPDSITWNANGTYDNNGGGLTTVQWDLNNDGIYETAGVSPSLGYDSLYGMIGPTEGRTIRLQVIDNEGRSGYATTTLAVYAQPVAGGRSQIGWLGKTGDVPSGRDADNLIDNGSNDPDHTVNPAAGIVKYEWDLNNDGVYEKTGSTSTQVTYNDFSAVGVTANENHTVTLRVTDNEGATAVQGGIRMPVLVNPTANAGGNYAVYQGGATALHGSGSDPDGGAITAYGWDMQNNGTYPVGGSDPTVSYDYLTGTMGLAPSETGYTINLRVTDNDADITGGWAGQGTATANIKVYANPIAAGRAQYGWLGKPEDVPSGWDWDNLTGNNSTDPDHTENPAAGIVNYAWDLNNDGVFEKSGGSSLRIYYSDFTALGITANENQTVTLRVTDNEGQTATTGGIRMPVLVNPVAEAGTDTTLSPGQIAHLVGSGYDPDGGGLTAYDWDFNGDGTIDLSGNILDKSYRELIDLGVRPGNNTVRLKVTDNDALIASWWSGTAEDTLVLTLVAPHNGDASCDGKVDVSDLGILAANYGRTGIGDWSWLAGDFNNDGIVDVSDLGILAANFGFTGGSVPEPVTLLLLSCGLFGFLRRKGV